MGLFAKGRKRHRRQNSMDNKAKHTIPLSMIIDYEAMASRMNRLRDMIKEYQELDARCKELLTEEEYAELFAEDNEAE